MGNQQKTIVLLGGGSEQIVVINICRELGYQTIVVDDNPEALGRPYADIFVNSKIKDVEQTLSLIREYKPSGIFTHAAELSVETAYFADALELQGIGYEAALNSTLKEHRLKCFGNGGVNIPKNVSLSLSDGLEIWRKAATEIGFPIVLKPNNSKGAVGVLLINDDADLFSYYRDQRESIGADIFIAEQFLKGTEYSTETVIWRGEMLRHNLALRHYDTGDQFFPYFIEDGHSMPINIDAGVKSKIIDQIEQSRLALGIENGVLKGDVLVNSTGEVFVIEMASRTSGGRFADFVTPLQCGVNILYSLLQIAMGDEVDISTLQEKWNMGVSQRFIFPKPGDSVSQIPRAEILRYREGVEDIVFSNDFLKTRLQNAVTSHQKRAGYVICRQQDRISADRMAIKLRDEIGEIIRS